MIVFNDDQATAQKRREVEDFLERNLQYCESWESNMKYLATYSCTEKEPERTQCELWADFAPLSFGFMMRMRKWGKTEYSDWFQGGLLFHGQLDGYGSGAAPTLAVTITPTDGWSVHT